MARNLDGSMLNTVLSGGALTDELNQLQTLRDKNCYWIFGPTDIRFNNSSINNQDSVTIDAIIAEDADLYCNGIHDPASWTHNDAYSVEFTVERSNSRWLIINRRVMQ